MSKLRENMERNVHALVDAYSRWELEGIMAPRTDDCIHQFLPMSLGHKPMNNEEYRKYFAMITPLFQDLAARADVEVYDEASKRVAVRLWTRASTQTSQHVIERACFLTMSDDGTKVVRFEEMTDPEANGRFYAEAMAQQRANRGKTGSSKANFGNASRSSRL